MDNVVKDWTTPSGLRAVILRNPNLGHLCGYVGIPKSHPCYGYDYHTDVPALRSQVEVVKNSKIGKRGIIPVFLWDGKCARMDVIFNVHGGITFAGGDGDYPVKSKLWWVGFDCGHAGDTPDTRNEAYVIAECESLAAQLLRVRPVRVKKAAKRG